MDPRTRFIESVDGLIGECLSEMYLFVSFTQASIASSV